MELINSMNVIYTNLYYLPTKWWTMTNWTTWPMGYFCIQPRRYKLNKIKQTNNYNFCLPMKDEDGIALF